MALVLYTENPLLLWQNYYKIKDMAKTRVAINGFGRIGRIFLRQSFDNNDLEVVAINDLGELNNLAYLLKYDSVYGKLDKVVEAKGGKLEVYGKEISFIQESNPSKLPWKEMEIDVVVESTGVFTTYEKAKGHIDAGAKRVIITAPAKDETTPIITPNVGLKTLGEGSITSNASCTTNAVNPVATIMSQNPGIEKAVLNTIHGYTSSQEIVDGLNNKDFRRGRAGAVNIIPTSTGAAIATTRSLPHLKDKFDGIAIRVPVISGSLIDFTFISSKETSVEEINSEFIKASQSQEWQGILTVTDEPIVSSDILGNSHGSVVDLSMTKVIDGNLVKILSWYDNEWGYCSMLMKHIEELNKFVN